MRFAKVGARPADRTVIYGPEGIGKTTLACAAPGPVALFDLDESTGALYQKLVQFGLADNVQIVDGVTNYAELMGSLNAGGWDDVRTICIDGLSRYEQLATQNTLATVKTDKGTHCTSIEGYGFGKGYRHLYESFCPLLAVLDRHRRQGRQIVLICHETTIEVENPRGQNWKKYDLRLTEKESCPLRSRVREWADHVLYVGLDVATDDDGKAKGSGSATVFPTMSPQFVGKSRTLTAAMPYEKCLTDMWAQMLK